MRPAVAQRLDAGFDDIHRRIEIGLADLQMDNVLALGFECPRSNKHFEGRLCAQPIHRR